MKPDVTKLISRENDIVHESHDFFEILTSVYNMKYNIFVI